MSQHYGSLEETDELYGTPAKYDAVLILPVVPFDQLYSRSNIKETTDRANLTVPVKAGASYIQPSPLNTRRIQMLPTPQQGRKGIVNYRPLESPIGPGHTTWTGIPQPTLPLPGPTPAAYMEIDPSQWGYQ